jgi:hypothetical protein
MLGSQMAEPLQITSLRQRSESTALTSLPSIFSLYFHILLMVNIYFILMLKIILLGVTSPLKAFQQLVDWLGQTMLVTSSLVKWVFYLFIYLYYVPLCRTF